MKPASSCSPARLLVLSFAALIIGSAVIWYVRKPQPQEIRQVLLISIDTCRADHLSCYGYSQETTPNIDAIADQGTLFENALSPLPYTLPAHCTMLTGTLPPFHGVLDNADYRLSEQITSLPRLLKDGGFSTAAFVSSFVLDARFGMDQGFDLYDDDFEDTSNTVGINQRRGDETTRRVIQWLDKHPTEKSFIFLHYYDPHFTYEPPEPFASGFKNVPPPQHVSARIQQTLFDGYAGEIAYTDQCIGQVIDKLKQLDLYDSTLIIITSDHGEMLGQHGEITHGYFVYQPALKVPLILKTPGHSRARKITDTVGIVDIMPTVCSMLNIEIPTPIQGQDLSACLSGGSLSTPDRHLLCQSLEPTKYSVNPLTGVVSDQYKYIRTTRPELYDLVSDPHELNNLAAQEPERLQYMEQALRDILETSTRQKEIGKAGLDEATRRRLESLGYISGTVKEDMAAHGTEDPKDLIQYHVRTMETGYLVHEKQYALAESHCRELIAQRPSFYRPYFNLAKIALMRDKPAEAIGHLKKVIELKPEDASSYAGLGEAHEALGQFDQAATSYAGALALTPDSVEIYHKLARCFYELNDFQAADKYITPDLTNNPKYVEAAVSLTDKLLAKQQIRLAYEHYVRILELDRDSVTVLNALAWIQAASSISGLANPEQAVTRALRACELTQFHTAEVIDTLAVAYAAAGRFPDAVKTAQKAIDTANSKGNTALARRIAKRLELYRAKRPYRDAALARDAGQ